MQNPLAIVRDEDLTKAIYDAERTVNYSNICELFENNFQKICRLIPLLPSIKDDHMALKDERNNLHLICHEKSPYTGTYTLTHKHELDGVGVNRPDIRFKLYFDAKLLEVISICEETKINSDHPNKSNCSDLALQWELNHFMLRWLDYCIDRYNGATWQKSK
ncbi:MAG: DUF1249 domain-containing protein [Gammaproteobacteria bacterium]